MSFLEAVMFLTVEFKAMVAEAKKQGVLFQVLPFILISCFTRGTGVPKLLRYSWKARLELLDEESKSDHINAFRAFEKWINAKKNFQRCYIKNFDVEAAKNIRFHCEKLVSQLMAEGCEEDTAMVTNKALRRILLAGFWPHLFADGRSVFDLSEGMTTFSTCNRTGVNLGVPTFCIGHLVDLPGFKVLRNVTSIPAEEVESFFLECISVEKFKRVAPSDSRITLQYSIEDGKLWKVYSKPERIFPINCAPKKVEVAEDQVKTMWSSILTRRPTCYSFKSYADFFIFVSYLCSQTPGMSPYSHFFKDLADGNALPFSIELVKREGFSAELPKQLKLFLFDLVLSKHVNEENLVQEFLREKIRRYALESGNHLLKMFASASVRTIRQPEDEAWIDSETLQQINRCKASFEKMFQKFFHARKGKARHFAVAS